jgi:L-lysine exporter family protein LysE/ArgO
MGIGAAFTQGWLTMAGLIVAIGAQNALVLRVGLARSHVGAVVAFCTLSDMALVMAGVFGLGAVATASPALMAGMRYGGAAFLLWCAARAATRAWRGDEGLRGTGGIGRLGITLATTAALTWLNPHVYLDTVVLLGAIGAQQPPSLRMPFALGASLASAMWFATLGWGAASLAPKLARRHAWRVIDSIIAAVMAGLAFQLLFLGLGP